MTIWHEYQEEAAAFFRSLGLIAKIDEKVSGVRGDHDVDVVVRSARAGIKQLWLVECKHWERPVDKLHVSALAEIVRDVGADRGLLLSESGFQAGAVRMAKSSNITLSSISDLNENSEDERTELGLNEARKRLSIADHRMHALRISERHSTGFSIGAVPGADMHTLTRVLLAVSSAQTALSMAEIGRWPVAHLGIDGRYLDEGGIENGHIAHSGKELLAGLSAVLTDVDRELASQEAAARAAAIGTQGKVSAG